MKQIYWPYIIAAYLALLSFGLLDNIRGPFFPNIITDLNLRDDNASWFFALTSIIAFFGSYWAPKIQEIIGALQGLRLALFLIAIGIFSASFSHSLSSLLMCSAVFGMGMGLLQVYEHICIQEGATPQLRRRLFNGLHSFYAAAALMAPLTAAFILGRGESWRLGFQWVSILPMLTFIYVLFVKRLDVTTEKTKWLKATGKELYHMLFLAVVLSLYVTAELSISTRLVLYVQRTTEISAAQSTWYLTAFFACLLFGRILSTVFAFEKLSSRQIILLALSCSFVFYVLGLILSPWWLALCGLSMAPIFGVTMDYIAHSFPEKSAHGISLAFAVGSILIVSMHYFVGLITRWYGIEKALILGPLFIATSFLLLINEKKLFAV
ncbi:MAG: MFS transporter [Bdellovibrionales bacterium]|nr:MFS transporter [Bdellovibrionales bacterium]